MKLETDEGLLDFLAEHLVEYQDKIQPLKEIADNGEGDEEYAAYDETYNIWLEDMHHWIEAHLKETGRLVEVMPIGGTQSTSPMFTNRRKETR